MDKLPFEILDKILNYLNVKDRCSAVLVSKAFYNAGCTFRNIRDLNFTFFSERSDEYNQKMCFSSVLNLIAKSHRIVNVTLLNFIIKDMPSIIVTKQYSEITSLNKLISLKIKNSNTLGIFDEHILIMVLRHCNRLQRLSLCDGCKFTIQKNKRNLYVNKPKWYLSDEIKNSIMSITPGPAFPSLKCLHIDFNHTDISNRYLYSLLRNAPYLEELLINNYLIKNVNMSLENIIDWVIIKAQRLKAITLSLDILDDYAIKRLILCDELNLEKVNITYTSISSTGIINLVSHQRNLRVLNLNHCRNITDYVLAAIKKYLRNLKDLHLNYTFVTCGPEANFYPRGRAISAAEVPQIKRMTLRYADVNNSIFWMSSLKTSLTNIDLSNCSAMNDDWFSVFPTWVPNLQELYLKDTNIASKGIWSIFFNLKDLQILDLSYCHLITDKSFLGVQPLRKKVNFNVPFATVSDTTEINLEITEHNLRVLYLDGCKKLTDYALAAIKKHLKNLKELYLNDTNVTCGYKSNFYPPGEDIFIAEAPQIKKMELQNCKIIESAKWMLSIRTSLTYIDLSNCTAMKDDWFSDFPTWVPNLHELYLNKTKIATKGVLSIFVNLKELRILELRTCDLITDEAFLGKEVDNKDLRCHLIDNQSLLIAIKKLRRLDISECKQITKAVYIKLGSVIWSNKKME